MINRPLRPGDLVTAGQLEGEVIHLRRDGSVEVIVEDFLGRRVLCVVEFEAITRRVAGSARRYAALTEADPGA